MTKKSLGVGKKVRLLLLVLVGILIVSVSWFLGSGGIEKIKLAYNGYRIRSNYSDSIKPLNSSLQQFGFDAEVKAKSICEYGELNGVEGKTLQCNASNNKYTVVGLEESRKNEFIDKSKELDKQLAENGWKTFSNTATNFEEWVSEVVGGVDYNTDIVASKTSENGSCLIQMTVAYSNPSPPAINTLASCDSPGLDLLSE